MQRVRVSTRGSSELPWWQRLTLGVTIWWSTTCVTAPGKGTWNWWQVPSRLRLPPRLPPSAASALNPLAAIIQILWVLLKNHPIWGLPWGPPKQEANKILPQTHAWISYFAITLRSALSGRCPFTASKNMPRKEPSSIRGLHQVPPERQGCGGERGALKEAWVGAAAQLLWTKGKQKRKS